MTLRARNGRMNDQKHLRVTRLQCPGFFVGALLRMTLLGEFSKAPFHLLFSNVRLPSFFILAPPHFHRFGVVENMPRQRVQG